LLRNLTKKVNKFENLYFYCPQQIIGLTMFYELLLIALQTSAQSPSTTRRRKGIAMLILVKFFSTVGANLSVFQLDKIPKFLYSNIRDKTMAAKVKPVQPTEIKDKKIALQVIEQIRKPIPARIVKRNEKSAEYVRQLEK
jgi:hypothetical protein